MLLTGFTGMYYATSDLAAAYNRVPVSDDTRKKLVSLLVENKICLREGFMTYAVP